MISRSDTADFVDDRPRERRLRLSDLDIDLPYVARELGYGEDAMPEPVQDAMGQALELAEPLVDARLLWKPMSCEVDAEADRLTVGGIRFDVGKRIRAHLAHANAVALFTVTIGHEVERKAREMMKSGQVMEGYGLDAVGSASAEACADRVESDVRAAAESTGWRITNRLSPGYCGWMTQEQQKLFSLLPGDPCGIRLSESSLMSPIKSVSGVIGLGPDVRYLDHMCSVCDMTTCYKRRAMQRSA